MSSSDGSSAEGFARGGKAPIYSQEGNSPVYALTADLALHSKPNSIQAELETITTVLNHLVASVARLQAGQEAPIATPTTTTSTTPTNTTPGTPTNTTAPLPFLLRPQHPCNIVSGRGASSPEVFQEMIKTNWHGRLGRTHMANVDGLAATALFELDCFLRRKLHAIFPRGGTYSKPDADQIFASLAVLGLRLEDRGAYADLRVIMDTTLHDAATIQRGRNYALCYYGSSSEGYWRGSVLETLIELARYRGLFDDEGFLKKE